MALPALHALLLGTALDEDAVCLLETALPCVIYSVLWRCPGATEPLESGSNVWFNIWWVTTVSELTCKHGRMWLFIFEEDFPTVKGEICHFQLPND